MQGAPPNLTTVQSLALISPRVAQDLMKVPRAVYVQQPGGATEGVAPGSEVYVMQTAENSEPSKRRRVDLGSWEQASNTGLPPEGFLQIAHQKPKVALGCRWCTRTFRYPSEVRTHERVHTGEKPYACAYCGQRFSASSNLRRHERRHVAQPESSAPQLLAAKPPVTVATPPPKITAPPEPNPIQPMTTALQGQYVIGPNGQLMMITTQPSGQQYAVPVNQSVSPMSMSPMSPPAAGAGVAATSPVQYAVSPQIRPQEHAASAEASVPMVVSPQQVVTVCTTVPQVATVPQVMYAMPEGQPRPAQQFAYVQGNLHTALAGTAVPPMMYQMPAVPSGGGVQYYQMTAAPAATSPPATVQVARSSRAPAAAATASDSDEDYVP